MTKEIKGWEKLRGYVIHYHDHTFHCVGAAKQNISYISYSARFEPKYGVDERLKKSAVIVRIGKDGWVSIFDECSTNRKQREISTSHIDLMDMSDPASFLDNMCDFINQ